MVLCVKDGDALQAHWHAVTPQSTGSQASTKSSGGSGPMGEPRTLTRTSRPIPRADLRWLWATH
eukprot:10341975-Prorocentrum_lima.AAC.1